MAIITIKASKATPTKGIEYITDQGKAALIDRRNLEPGNEAEQMMQTAKLWGKAQGEDARKYYHMKLAFAPEDWAKNGGPLTEEEALAIGMEILQKVSPTAESIGAVHTDKDHLHFHGIVNAVDLETGKLLDMRRGEYAKLKDLTQEICAQHGLTAMDWRKATKEKREREGQSQNPVDETFAEQGLKARGKATWKDELRQKIDSAARSSKDMAAFRAALKKEGVELTRCTEQTISYRLGDHKAVRGDSLGGDYTAAAIRDALQHNLDAGKVTPEQPAPGEKKLSLTDQIGGAERKRDVQATGGRVIGKEERDAYREFGRMAGVKRSEIDALCDSAEKATWMEKQAVWKEYKQTNSDFWTEYNARREALKEQMDEAKRQRQKVKDAEWALNPRNRRRSLFGSVYALIVLAKSDSRFMIEAEIFQLKKAQEDLYQYQKDFRRSTGDAKEALLQKGLPLDEYMAAVKQMQEAARKIQMKNYPLLDEEAVRKRTEELKKSRHQKQSWSR